MKNILLYLVLMSIFQEINASKNLLYSEYSQEISVYDLKNGDKEEYYLVSDSIANIYSMEIIRSNEDGSVIAKVKKTNNNKDIITYTCRDNNWKISSFIQNRKMKNHRKELFSIKYDDNANFLMNNNNSNNFEIVRELPNSKIQIVRTTLGFISKVLIHISEIEFIDIVKKNPIEESPIRQYLPELSRINVAKNDYPNLDGTGLVISIKENSINESSDIDLIGKVTLNENSSEEFTQHAKEMGTLINGAGNSFRTGSGVVTNAKIVCTDFSLLFAEDPNYYSSNQISVQNHSYGTGIENYYGTESISYDQSVIDLPHLVHVFSAGNSGKGAPTEGKYAGLESYANITGNYKQSKNVLVVAALDSTMNHFELTSSGPAYDGRIKPELAAFGAEGTSESAAIVSGSVAMIQDHYSNLNNSMPKSSLVKSILIAAANEADREGIDFRTGYGSINLNKSLQLLDSGWYNESTINSNQTNSQLIEIPENTAELKVVISWIDPPANPEDAISLVNDLDMVIEDPNGTVWHPWILDSAPDVIALSATATRGEDHLNNTEMVSIANPTAGSYTLRIKSNDLVNQNQGYSIAFFMKQAEHFEWSYPVSSDKLEAGSKTYLRWENTFSSQTVNIHIQYGDEDWEFLGSTNTTAELYYLPLKDTTANAKVKAEIGTNQYVSDEFNISPLLELNIENDCTDDFTISWNGMDNAETFNVFELQNDQLVSVLNTSDTIANFSKSIFTGSHYAVSPVVSGIEGLRSFSVNYENRNQGCYITNFLVSLEEENFFKIELSINVPFEIDEINIWRISNGNSEIFKNIKLPHQNSFSYEDHNLEPGNYIYYAELVLKDSRQIYSNEQSLFFTDKSTIVVFPNPIINDDFVNILNDYPGGTLQLIDGKGNFVKSFDLVNTVEEINLHGLKKGIYSYRILFESTVVNTGRVTRL